jgi:hypothetical protein
LSECVIPQQSQAASKQSKPAKSAQPEKEKLVLMPLRVPEEDKNFTGAMETIFRICCFSSGALTHKGDSKALPRLLQLRYKPHTN